MNLLILSCSARKRSLPIEPIAAIDRYDGQFFRILRKSGVLPGRQLTVVILSARYGFLLAETPIPDYDRKMTPDQVRLFRPTVDAAFAEYQQRHWSQIFVNLGHAYMPLVREIPFLQQATVATGSIGVRSRQLKNWLEAL